MTISTFGIGAQADVYNNLAQFPKAEGYNLRIGEQWFRTVSGPGDMAIRLGTRDSLAERADTRGSTAQNVLDIGYAWARTDLSGGEGLDWDPRELALERQTATQDPIRFWDSNFIDIRRPETAGQKYTIRVSRTTEVSDIAPAAPGDLAASDDFLYVGDGADIEIYEDWAIASLVTTETLPDTVVALAASPFDAVMAVAADGIVYYKPPGITTFTAVWTPAAPSDPTGVWYINGRFVVATQDLTNNVYSLAEVYEDGVTPAYTFDTAAAPFVSVVESGPAVVAACLDGTVRTYTPDTGEATLPLLPRSRTQMPDGETPWLLGSNAGILLILTSSDRDELVESEPTQELRLYQSEVLDERFNFVIGQRQLRREWFGAEHEPLTTRNMANTRDEVFWYIREVRNGTFEEALWRFDVVTTGINRQWSQPGVDLNAITIFNDKGGGIDFAAPAIVVGSDDTFWPVGYIIFPNITFGLNTDISWLSTVLEAQDLEDIGAQVELYRSVNPDAILDPNDPSWILERRLSSPGGSGLDIPMTGVKSRTISLQLRIGSTNGNTVTPKVSRTAIRGIPAHRDFIMLIPVNVSDYVSAPNRKPVRYPGLGHALHSRLLSLVGDTVETALLDPPVLFRGVINNISEPIEYQSPRGSVTRYCVVEFRGQQLQTTVPAVGDDGMGLGLLGISTMGLGQTVGV